MSRNTTSVQLRESSVTVALSFLVAVFEGIDLQAAGVAAPKLGPALGLNPGQLGWFFSASTFGLMLGAAIGGRLSDRYGRKTVLICAVAVFGFMSVMTGLAGNVETLQIARFLTGLGIGAAMPNLLALVCENTPPGRNNTAVGWMYAGLPSGGALASLVAALAGSKSWSTVFFVGGVAPLVAIPLLVIFLPESRQLRTAQRSIVPGKPGQRGFMFALFGDGRANCTLLLWFSFFLALLTMYLLLNWLPSLLVGRGMSKPDASLVQLSFNVCGALGSICTGRLMDRFSLHTVVATAFLCAAACLLLLAHVTPILSAALVIGALVGITMSATQAIMYAIGPGIYPTEIRGTGVGSAVAVGRIGSAVGPLLAAALLSTGASAQQVLQMVSPLMLIAGASALFLVTLTKRRRVAEWKPERSASRSSEEIADNP